MSSPQLRSAEFIRVEKNPSLEKIVSLVPRVAGVDFCFCLATEEMDGVRNGWQRVADAPYFKFEENDCVVMWRGSPRPGASLGSALPDFFFGPQLKAVLFPEQQAEAKSVESRAREVAPARKG